ncbi:glucan biosynthesis protein G [Aestuariivirga litoralis]|uniref:glucan biosynthesis protein G n=1 Tax=Aestuariivirga litoralis TaxID=2650924 RepID=UPI0018C6BC8A|nr:glucan biosynthesis protein G [Aestuariivirga litoralis]MBG1231386.1 glucan biosynthesis protein G [Aestuariivirga litoralis]
MSSTRRQFLSLSAQLAATVALLRESALPAFADAPVLYEKPSAFAEDHVKSLAKALAAKPFVDEKIEMPKGFDSITYDQYRDIRFNPDRQIWKGEAHGFSFDMFHSGFLFTRPVDVYVIQDDQQSRLKYDPSLFIFGPKITPPDAKVDLHYAGIRLRYPINNANTADEIAVFQGASYFRAVAKGLNYGLSARGLAIDTGQPSGEEFPFFKAFWIKRPEAGTGTIVVHALLDSPSVAGAYRFAIKPGEDTQMDVEVTLYPRRDLEHAGIAPLTSMYLFGPMARPVEDFREAVHDSNGVMMLTGRGEWIWRPLNNPKTLQVSYFEDQTPRGFGLMQRTRSFEDFRDIEARYERRPSAWIEPIGDWGAGFVTLFEIPSNVETNDNMVAYWQPKDPLKQGSEYSYVYRLHWCPEWPLDPTAAAVKLVTFSGSGVAVDFTTTPPTYDPGKRIYVIEYSGPGEADEFTATATASAGTVDQINVIKNDVTGAIRVTFRHDASGLDSAELRANLKRGDTVAGETWLYRWVKA